MKPQQASSGQEMRCSMSRREIAVRKTAVKAAQALSKSCDAMNAYLRACRDAGLPFKGADDGRLLLIEQMSEFHSYLSSIYDKEGGAA